MFSGQGNRKTRSQATSQELAATTSNPERIMCNRDSPSNLKILRQAELRRRTLQIPEASIEAAHESDNEGSPFTPTAGQDPTPAFNPFISSRSLAPELKSTMKKAADGKTILIIAEPFGP